MKKRYLGNIEVSEIGIGCMGFSHGYGDSENITVYCAFEYCSSFMADAEKSPWSDYCV